MKDHKEVGPLSLGAITLGNAGARASDFDAVIIQEVPGISCR